jgi:hypothetical protein
MKKILKYAKKCKIKISTLKFLLHESNYKLGKHRLRLTKKRCILHWNPGPSYKIQNNISILILYIYILIVHNITW